MIEEIRFRSGSYIGQKALSIFTPRVVVFVGPNNSGKSQLLREINTICTSGNSRGSLVIDQILFKEKVLERAESDLMKLIVEPHPHESVPSGFAIVEKGLSRYHVSRSELISACSYPNLTERNTQMFAEYYCSFYTLNLDGPSRIQLANPRAKGDLKSPENAFSRLLTDDIKRNELRNVIYDAVGLYLGIDMSEGSELKLKFGNSPPPNERCVEDTTLDWMRKAKSIAEVSDGVKAFAGILIELRAGNPQIALIDEPEAFLHPSLAFKLGKEIAKTIRETDKCILVSTHSAHFLAGIINSGAQVDVVRLTYKEDIATARLLANDDLSKMMLDPLLRSANSLSALFYENVVVTEADADRAFYQEINERLLEFTSNRGIPNALFMNANGKDTVHRIVEPLRRLGIPAVSVLDIDALRLGGAAWTNHLRACGIPLSQHQPLSAQRATTWKDLCSLSENPKTGGGLDLLDPEKRAAAEILLRTLDDHGMFILRHGEVEGWLPSLDVSRSKSKWLHNIFAAMGSNRLDSLFVRPQDNDVWAFVDSLASWLRKEGRLGMFVN